ncbi:ATP-binding protein [uncultured Succinivibrio sp.]|uniref:ATP-binding protein n=1 Tax=uncultured Succinivibrio sp. TaxID=540749 RepID=UPI0025D6E305|nr:ATP-binding protein [uncultured Succinivibrio sp.]
MYPRQQYLEKLISKKDNGRIKIITGLRRCGKSVLLFELYRNYLLGQGVNENQIISLALDGIENVRYRNPFELDKYIRDKLIDNSKKYYILLDEIQFVAQVKNPYLDDPENKISFVDVILGIMKFPNTDIYITGSNSKMLSSDILTQFRDRGDEIRVFPLSFAEFYSETDDKRAAWQEYYTYGGMPFLSSKNTHEEKSLYLRELFTRTYLKDVLERHKIRNNTELLEILLDVLASGIGSLSNPSRLSNTFKSERNISVNADTIEKYIEYFEDSFLICKAKRYDVKGKKYIGTPVKYYFADTGLRNARLNFRQLEETHLMENILYIDLIRRGLDVDVGVVEYNTKDDSNNKIRKQLEVDFVVNKGSSRYYIQSALSISSPQKKEQEIASLKRIPDSFTKIVVVKDYLKPWQDENGIIYIGIEQFLLDENMLK